MITAITDKIAQLIHSKYAGYAIYDDGQVPQNFTRPSFCIVDGKTRHRQLNIRIWEHELSCTIYLFPTLSDSHRASQKQMQEILSDINDIFRAGCIEVSGRAVKVKGQTESDISEQDGYLEVTLTWKDSVTDGVTEKMTNIHIKEN